jgi:nucleoside-diphosphate-sugar epimerase
MRVLITGATGFVLSNLARHLAAAGHDVVSLDRFLPDEPVREFLSGLPGSVAFRTLDVTDAGAVRTAVRDIGPGRVVHGAALTSIPPDTERARFVETAEVNIGGTLNVLEACRAHGVLRIVVVSSGSVYGPRPDLTPIHEEDAKEPVGVYGVTKWAADALARRWAVVHDIELAVVRLASPFGPLERDTGSRPLLSRIREWTTSALAGAPVVVRGSMDAVRDVVHVSDVASGIAAVLLTPTLPHDAYNVGWGQAATAAEVVAALTRVLPHTKVDHRPGEPSQWGALERGPLNADRLRADFRWAPRLDLESGLREYVSWLSR